MAPTEQNIARWRTRYADAGYRDRTAEEWVEQWRRHPEFYEDLYAVVFGGATLVRITAQRRRDDALDARRAAQ